MSKQQESTTTGFWRILKQEPLIHFILLAVLIFVADAVLIGDTREVITVDAAAQEYLIKQRQELLLRPMTSEEKDTVIQDYIEEEILVREARKRGFESSSRIRTLLIQNMRFFMTSEIPVPTEEDLRAYYDDNKERFETSPSVTYEQASFTNPDNVPADTLEKLNAGVNYRTIGDTNLFTARLPRISEKGVVASFGREQARSILAIDDDRWHGPFTSPAGVHFLRVETRYPGMRPDFEAARNWIEQEWLMQKRNEIIDRELTEMRQNYRIEIAQPVVPAE